MAPMVVAFILGWWLVARSRAQQPRQPFLSLHPSNGVALRDNVTLRCHLPQPALWVLLYRNKVRIWHLHSIREQNTTEFFYGDVERTHAGTYQCRYEDKETRKLSVLSDPVELVVTDVSFPPPGTTLSPSGRVETGTNVTIQCWASHGATFLLHKDGRSPPIQRQDPQKGDTATFTLPGVTPADAGTYRCSYIPHGYPFLASPLGDKVTLEVTPASGAPQGTEGGPWRTLVVAVGGGCATAAALVFSLGLFFLIIARRRRRGAFPQGLGAMELQVPPRGPWPQEDSECLTYADLRPPAPGPPRVLTTPQPPIIYAEVGAGGPH